MKTKVKNVIIAGVGLAAVFGAVSAGVFVFDPQKMSQIRDVVSAYASNEYALPPPTATTPLSGPEAEFLKSFSKVFSNISKEASPALVLIVAEKKVTVPQGDFPDEFFFPFMPPQFQGPKRKQGVETAAGSGFFVDLKRGYVITNNHVIDGADKITVTTYENRKYTAKLVGTAQNLDVAVLKLEDGFKASSSLKQLSLADSDKVEVGDWVVALGAPFDLPQTVTMGVVSAVKRSSDTLGINGPNSFIQTDAPINPGNSGGPLVNLNGQVIGMNTAIFSKNGGSVGIGFAIPSNTIRLVGDSLINKGKIMQVYLGIEMYDIHKFSAQALKEMNIDPNTEGGLVMRVMPNSPAAGAGLQPYDIIQSINGKTVHSPSDIQAQVMFLKPGTKVQIGVQRNGKHENLVATVAEAPSQKMAQDSGNNGNGQQQTRSLAAEYGLKLSNEKSHVVITGIDPRSVANAANLQPGTVILQVNRQSVKSVNDVEKILEGLKKAESNSLTLLVEDRAGNKSVVILQVG